MANIEGEGSGTGGLCGHWPDHEGLVGHFEWEGSQWLEAYGVTCSILYYNAVVQLLYWA